MAGRRILKTFLAARTSANVSELIELNESTKSHPPTTFMAVVVIINVIVSWGVVIAAAWRKNK